MHSRSNADVQLFTYAGRAYDIRKRNRVHDKEGVNSIIRGLNATDKRPWDALVWCSFGKRMFCDVPLPVLAAAEVLLIGGARLTRGPNACQVNIFDRGPAIPVAYLRGVKRKTKSTAIRLTPMERRVHEAWKRLHARWMEKSQVLPLRATRYSE